MSAAIVGSIIYIRCNSNPVSMADANERNKYAHPYDPPFLALRSKASSLPPFLPAGYTQPKHQQAHKLAPSLCAAIPKNTPNLGQFAMVVAAKKQRKLKEVAVVPAAAARCVTTRVGDAIMPAPVGPTTHRCLTVPKSSAIRASYSVMTDPLLGDNGNENAEYDDTDNDDDVISFDGAPMSPLAIAGDDEPWITAL